MDTITGQLDQLLETFWKEKLLEEVLRAGMFGKQKITIKWDADTNIFVIVREE